MTPSSHSRAGALGGVRILDLTSVVFGPYASQILADYGADVIKIEAPSGDSTRRTGPSQEPGLAAIFLGLNRNKRSIVLDLKQAAARQALLTMVDQADVLMHSMRPAKMAALGLDPAAGARGPAPSAQAQANLLPQGAYAGRASPAQAPLLGARALVRDRQARLPLRHPAPPEVGGQRRPGPEALAAGSRGAPPRLRCRAFRSCRASP